ncbi:MAG: DUF3298 domain-containing protein [Clostridiales bacterium]|nr:DUF3298 domain-containing protein [Clostridiales bacterium]
MTKRITVLLLVVFMVMLAACRSEGAEQSPVPSASEPPASGSPIDGEPSDTPGTTPEESPVVTGPDYIFADINDNFFEKEYSLEGANEKITGELYIAVPEITISEYQENADMINEYFENMKEKYREGFEYELTLVAEDEELYGHSANRFMDLSFSTEYNKDGIVSFMITVVSYQGGAHDNIAIMSETFDLSNGTRITADNLFTVSEEEYTTRIKQYILAEMDKNVEKGDAMYFDNYHELLDATYDKEAFVLTEDSLHVYFQVYDLAPFAAGLIQFDIPYEYLKDILNPQYGLIE